MLITYSFLKCWAVTWKTWIYFKYILAFLSDTLHTYTCLLFHSVNVTLSWHENSWEEERWKFALAECLCCSLDGVHFLHSFASLTYSSLLNMVVLLHQFEALCMITLEIMKYFHLLHWAIICNLKSIFHFAF